MTEQFFTLPFNKDMLQKFVSKSDVSISPHYIETQLRVIVHSMNNNPEEWDKRCSYNIKAIGDQFISRLREYDFKAGITEKLFNTFASAYRFLYEYYFFLESEEKVEESDLFQIYMGYLDAELHNKVKLRIVQDTTVKMQEEMGLTESQVQKYTHEPLPESSQELNAAEVSIKYAIHLMPVELIRHYLRRKFLLQEGFKVFSEFENKSLEAKKYIDDWDKNLEIKKSAVEVLQEKLDKQTAGFNFVGLYDGFKNLLKEKKYEAESNVFFLTILAIIILIPLVVSVLYVVKANWTNEWLN